MTEEVVEQTRTVRSGTTEDSPRKSYQTKKAIFRSYQIIWYVLSVIEVLLGFRIVLKFLGANALSGFTNFIYTISDPFALPFAGILGTTVSSTLVFEWSTFIAMAVYAVVAYGLVALFQLVKPTDQEEVEKTVDSK